MVRFETPYNRSTTPPHRNAPKSAPGEPGAPVTGSRKWNSWWSRRSPNIETNDMPPACIGIDAGSKTLKLVMLDEAGEIVHGLYHRHRSDVRTSLAELVHDVIWRYGDMTVPIAITGSAGIALAEELGLPFVQEVIATSTAVRARYPQADCIVELGGEDAKITYLTGTPEQRMNATCAGGTGDFIDGIASMLGCKTREISKLALGSQHTYPIASRCAVFAQTDVRPLVNAGVAKADIAQSALEAVVNQTLGGLACGRPISGNVVFLGGPLEHIPALLMTFRRKLGLSRRQCIKPPDAHLFTAMGAVLTAENPPAMALSTLEGRLLALDAGEGGMATLPPLFDDPAQRSAFIARHTGERVAEKRVENATGPLYLGFDAGSTTMKYALIDAEGALVASDYRAVDGDTLKTAQTMLGELLDGIEAGNRFGKKRRIARAVVCGYGEDLLRAAFGFDDGIVETVAHLKAAQHFHPDVSFVLDIGGQDMKALWIRDGAVVDAVLNEACSSGCGAFVQSCAKSLALSHDEFSRQALSATQPIDLGAKCTVFMTSRVRHAQKAGASTADIAAGIAYSIANNVTGRLIGAGRAGTFGANVVVQGGAFKSDAVLRAFEKVAGVEATRPSIAHIMGAFGAALVARGQGGAEAGSTLLDAQSIQALDPDRSSMRCTGCANACLASVVDFGDGRHFVSGNRCERARSVLFGEEGPEARRPAPNVVALEQKLVSSFGTTRNGPFSVGLMNAMNTYAATPFWHTLFDSLGFSVIMPDDDRAAALEDRARETIPSESACFPAKLSHLRYADLHRAGADTVFMPRFERGTRCPVAASYASVLDANMEQARISAPLLHAIRPSAIAADAADCSTVYNLVASWDPSILREDFNRALATALEAQRAFEDAVCEAAANVLEWLAASPDRRAAVIAMRPYHADPALLHGIDRELARLGFAVIPQLALSARSARKPLWKPAKGLVRAIDDAAGEGQLEIVALRSFGCGFDAVSFDEARDLAIALHRPFTELKIDEIADTAHVRIRLRTLAYTTRARKPTGSIAASGDAITPDLCSTAKNLVELAASQLSDGPVGRLRIPRTCLKCLTDALPFELEHLGWELPPIDEVPGGFDIAAQPPGNGATLPRCGSSRPSTVPSATASGADATPPTPVGLLGNPLLVFNPLLNDHVVELLESLGCRAVYPEPELIEVEDVRYLEQLERFQRQGIRHVIYLQSFGCLKGHVQSRGAARELARLFPGMRITIVDYDSESSALNRENRIRLGVSR